MDIDIIENDIDQEKIQFFIDIVSNFSWMLTADESVIDNVINVAAAIQESFLKEEDSQLYQKMVVSNPRIDFKKSLDLLLKIIIKNPNLNEYLTLYAIKKYTLINPTHNLYNILENILLEINLRENLTQLYEILSDGKVVDVEWHKINSLLQEINSSKTEICEYKILNALKTQASVVLSAVEYGFEANGLTLLKNMIECLESQSNLKLWFALMKEKNLPLVLDLCSKHQEFLNAVLKFFEKFAEEIETNYDEDLNFEYSHLNLDFDEFLKIIKLFLNDNNISKVISEFIENKILYEDKNFLFWVDVKACSEME